MKNILKAKLLLCLYLLKSPFRFRLCILKRRRPLTLSNAHFIRFFTFFCFKTQNCLTQTFFDSLWQFAKEAANVFRKLSILVQKVSPEMFGSTLNTGL